MRNVLLGNSSDHGEADDENESQIGHNVLSLSISHNAECVCFELIKCISHFRTTSRNRNDPQGTIC